jgi:hypothetical protein
MRPLLQPSLDRGGIGRRVLESVQRQRLLIGADWEDAEIMGGVAQRLSELGLPVGAIADTFAFVHDALPSRGNSLDMRALPKSLFRRGPRRLRQGLP